VEPARLVDLRRRPRAVSLLSKHVHPVAREHIFNPSNFGLVICFLALGRNRAGPARLLVGPMSVWLAIALAVIVTAGSRSWDAEAPARRGRLLAAFAAGIGVLALAGHVMIARWHLGPISGFHFWWVLITSPEVLVFLFFMITDPKTAPRASEGAAGLCRRARALLASVLIAPYDDGVRDKVALLGSLAIVCLALSAAPARPRAARPAGRARGRPRGRRRLRRLDRLSSGPRVPPASAAPGPVSSRRSRSCLSRGVQTQLDRHTPG
jgi:hypothetical protein